MAQIHPDVEVFTKLSGPHWSKALGGVMRNGAVLMILVEAFSGCSTYAASRYSISAPNVSVLRAFRGQTVSVGPFTATKPGRNEITCRAVGPIRTPDGEPFEEFIRKALIDELTIAEIYAAAAPVTLTGRLDEIDFSSGMTDAAWQIALTVASSNGKSVTVRETYEFKGNFAGDIACQQTAHALLPAVQNVVGKIVHHPEFPALLEQQ